MDFARYSLYFNCTIQELKPMLLQTVGVEQKDFNCTIQELKQLWYYYKK